MSDRVGSDVSLVNSLVHAADDAPLRHAVMWMDELPDDGMTGYRRLAAAVIAQLAHDSTRTAAVNLDGTLQALARLSASEEFAVWAHVLELDPEDLIDGIITRLARSVSAAAD